MSSDEKRGAEYARRRGERVEVKPARAPVRFWRAGHKVRWRMEKHGCDRMTAEAGGAPARAAWVHGLCVLAAAAALLPIAVGAVVTTDKAGMAFPDWPTSDGYGLFSYPWLRAAGDKFMEHSHRLAGAVMGVIAIAVACASWMWERRRWVQGLAVALLVSVVVQGLLGGLRVRLNARTLAMLHAVFVNVVMSASVLMALATSAWWRERGGPRAEYPRLGASDRWGVTLLAGLVLLQYGLGSFLRHFGMMMHEHVAAGVLVLAAAIWVAWSCVRVGRPAWLRRFGWALGLLVIAQVSLGAGAYVSRFGFPALGWVAVAESTGGRLLRSAHTCGGILLLATVINLAICVWIAELRSSESVEAVPCGFWEPAAREGGRIS